MLLRRAVLPLTLLPLLLIGFVATAGAQDVAGDWQGEIEIPGAPLAIVISLQQDEGMWVGTIDIPAQGATGLPLQSIVEDDGHVRFAIGGVPGDPTFDGSLVDGRIEGTYSQEGQSFPFELRRIDAPGAGPESPDPLHREPAPGEPVAPAALADPTPTGEYEDPEGRFSSPIPTNWSATDEGGYARLADPESGVIIYLLALEEEDLDAAIFEGWARVEPGFALESDQRLEPPSEPGVEQTVFIDFDAEDDRVVQALAQRHEGIAYLLLVDSDLGAAQRRASQISIVLTGFTIAALDEDDLSGVRPLPVTDVLPELESFIRDGMAAAGIPGAAVAIVQDGEVVFAEGFGTTVAGGGEPVSPSTHMMIGSTGKTMTTLLMAVLVDEGLLDWDTPAVEVLPGFEVADPDLSREITVRNLVCACTGVPRRDMEIFFRAGELDAEGVVESLRTVEFLTDFGEAFQYSNQLVATGGYAAAAADGAEVGRLHEGYAASLDERVLQPAGMRNTTLSFENVRARGEHGIPHQTDLGTGDYTPVPLDVEEVLVPLAPAGAHWSTAEDMARYLLLQLSGGVAEDGTRVVSEANLRTTWEPQVPMTARMSYGLGWMVDEYKGLELLHHGGNTLGFTADFAFIPEAGIGIVVLTNAQGSNFFNTALRTFLFELVWEQPFQSQESFAYGLERTHESLEELKATLLGRVDSDAVEPWVGLYHNAALGEVEFTLEEGRFMMDAGEFTSELRPVVDDAGEVESFITWDAPIARLSLTLRRDDDGAPLIRLGEGVTAYDFSRVEGSGR